METKKHKSGGFSPQVLSLFDPIKSIQLLANPDLLQRVVGCPQALFLK